MRTSTPIKNVPKPAAEIEAIFSMIQMFFGIIATIVGVVQGIFNFFEDAFGDIGGF